MTSSESGDHTYSFGRVSDTAKRLGIPELCRRLEKGGKLQTFHERILSSDFKAVVTLLNAACTAESKDDDEKFLLAPTELSSSSSSAMSTLGKESAEPSVEGPKVVGVVKKKQISQEGPNKQGSPEGQCVESPIVVVNRKEHQTNKEEKETDSSLDDSDDEVFVSKRYLCIYCRRMFKSDEIKIHKIQCREWIL